MGKALDLRGQRFGRLVAIEPTDRRSRGVIIWRCICDCGNEHFTTSVRLHHKLVKSCGCLRGNYSYHGMFGTPTHKSWEGMKSRCNDPNNSSYKYYGGRGIKVCERWHKFENFYADMGERPKGMTLDRINNDGDYEPRNCKWATYKEQRANSRPISRGPCKQYWFRAWHKDQMCQYLSNNQHEFAEKHKLCSASISQCLLNKRKHHKGWIFQRI